MIDDVLAIPDQLRDALWRVETARLEAAESAGLDAKQQRLRGFGGGIDDGAAAAREQLRQFVASQICIVCFQTQLRGLRLGWQCVAETSRRRIRGTGRHRENVLDHLADLFDQRRIAADDEQVRRAGGGLGSLTAGFG